MSDDKKNENKDFNQIKDNKFFQKVLFETNKVILNSLI